MEAKYEYQIFDEDRKKKVQGIEGLYDLMAAIVEKAENDLDSVRCDQKIAELEQKYPRAAVYLKAQDWKWSPDMRQSVLGCAAIERVLNGDDPAAVQEEMESKWAAFQLAQEG